MPDNVIIYEWFANFVTEKPQKRKSYVSKVINKEPYVFYKDFYSVLRTKLISILRNKKPLTELNGILKNQKPIRQNHYEILINQIQNYFKDKRYTWIEPPKNIIEYSGLLLKVNPEIGLKLSNRTLFIKMYLKQPLISNSKIKVMQKIMQDTLKDLYPDARVAILDIRRGILHEVSINERIKIPYNLEHEALIWQKYAEED